MNRESNLNVLFFGQGEGEVGDNVLVIIGFTRLTIDVVLIKPPLDTSYCYFGRRR